MASITGPWPYSSLQSHPTQPLHTWQWQLCFNSKTGILIFTIPRYSNGFYHRSLAPLLPTAPSHPTLYIPGSDSCAFILRQVFWYSQFLATVMASITGPWPHSSLQPHPTQPLHTWQWQLGFYSKTGILIFTIPRYSNGFYYRSLTPLLPTTPSYPTLYIPGSDSCAFILRQVFWYSQFLATVMASITGPWPHSSLQPHPTQPLHTWQWQLGFYSKTGILIFTIPRYSNGFYYRSLTPLLPTTPSYPTLYIPGSDSCAFILRQVFWYSQFLATVMASITGPWPHSSLQSHPTQPLHTWQWQLGFYSKTGILIFTIPRYSNGFYYRSMTTLLPSTPSHPTLYIPGSDSWAFILRQVFWYSQFLATAIASITGPWPHSSLQPHPTQPLHTWQWQLCFYSKTGILIFTIPCYSNSFYHRSLDPLLPTTPSHPTLYIPGSDSCAFILRQVFWYSQFLATVMASITGPWPHSSLQPHPTQPLHTWQWQLCFYSKTGILIFTIPCYSNGFYHRSMTTLLPTTPSHPTPTYLAVTVVLLF